MAKSLADYLTYLESADYKARQAAAQHALTQEANRQFDAISAAIDAHPIGRPMSCGVGQTKTARPTPDYLKITRYVCG